MRPVGGRSPRWARTRFHGDRGNGFREGDTPGGRGEAPSTRCHGPPWRCRIGGAELVRPRAPPFPRLGRAPRIPPPLHGAGRFFPKNPPGHPRDPPRNHTGTPQNPPGSTRNLHGHPPGTPGDLSRTPRDFSGPKRRARGAWRGREALPGAASSPLPLPVSFESKGTNKGNGEGRRKTHPRSPPAHPRWPHSPGVIGAAPH